jgi:hypothetical protein
MRPLTLSKISAKKAPEYHCACAIAWLLDRRGSGRDAAWLAAKGYDVTSPFWIMLLLVWGSLDNGMIPVLAADTGVAKMPSTEPTPQRPADQLTRALGQAVIRIWSNLPQDVQNHLFQEAVRSQGESIRPQLAVFLHNKHPRTLDPLGKPREMTEPDSLGG